MSKIKNEISFNLDSVYGSPLTRTGHFGIHYRQIPCVKCPFDYVLYQMIIMSVKPDLIIEIGTYKGGSALYYSDLLNLLGGLREVHTIDIESNINSDLVKNNKSIKLFTEGFQNYDVSLISNFSNIMIIDDGSHTYNDVIDSLNKFSKYVPKGSYFIVEDGVITNLGLDQSFNGGPTRAIEEFITNDSSFSIDRNYCDFFGTNATFNPNGFLRKN
jgi:cephalosporin hydroxylase